MNKIDLNKYQDFVQEVTSQESNDSGEMSMAISRLEETGVNVSLLLTGAVGISAEGGELMAIVKKCIFQGKPLSEEKQFHEKRELAIFCGTGLTVAAPLT